MKTIKKLTIVLCAIALSVYSFDANAQSKTKKEAAAKPVEIAKIVEGRVLSEADLGFLNAVMADKGSKSRGESNVATIESTTFEVGHEVTAEDVKLIDSAIANSNNVKKVKNEDKSRGGCNLWCYYYLQDSYGNWYYYYYCCG